MKDTIDRSFKYAMQDTNRIYIGGRMTYEEMITWEEVPFKIKSIVNRDFLPDAKNPEWTFKDHFKTISDTSFLFQILKTLKTKVKVDYPVTKGKAGKEQTVFKSKVCNIEEYIYFVQSSDAALAGAEVPEGKKLSECGLNPDEVKEKIRLPKGMEDIDYDRLTEVVTEEISFSKLAVMFFSK